MQIKFRLVGLFAGLCLPLHSVFGSEPEWQLYDTLLAEHVTARVEQGVSLSWVNYTALRRDPDMMLLVDQISRYPVSELQGDERKAFYINSYNILALKTVADNWPIDSIRDLGNWFSPVWDRKAGDLGGEPVTLGQIEHEILRPLGDPRIHMAIVCASLSCPDLRTEAYRAARLNQQLDDQTRRFLTNPGKGVQLGGNKAKVSRIFDWFAKDFESEGGVATWIAHYLEQPLPQRFGYLDYRWQVNGN
ncbi:MAG TPA: DUF547 domain-containing protein [Motiliproteus sp.]